MIPNQRSKFDIPDDVAYFNCAFMSPILASARDAGLAAVTAKSHPWETQPGDFFNRSNECRKLFAKLVCAQPEDIAIIPSASYGLAVAAHNLPMQAGQNILVLEDQFPSNIYTWRKKARQTGGTVKTLSRTAGAQGVNQPVSWTEVILDAIDDNTALIALPHCLWTDGGLIDVVAVGHAARAHNAALVLDITQSGGAMPIDMSKVEPDFVICACYKWLLGPYALGFMYVHPKWHDGDPLEEGWITRQGSSDFTTLIDYRDAYQPGALRFDMGERSSFQLMPIAQTAMQQLVDWGVDNIYQTLTALTQTIAQKATALGFEAEPAGIRAGHYLGLRAAGDLPENLTARLAEAGIYVSKRGTSLRVTPHLYNTQHDCDRLLNALADLI